MESRRVRYSYWPASESGSGSACRVAYAGGPLGIKLKIHRRANGWRRSAVTTGDETFDGLMLVKTNDPDRLSLALDASVTRQILDLAFDGRLRITDKIISLTEQIKDPTAAAIVATILRLIAVAEAVERARPASGRSP